jgi:UDP-N-acetylglucosamine 2-epimerase
MIHVLIGTKAQYIKTAPVILRLEREGIPHRLIDSGQHAAFSRGLRAELGLREPDLTLGGGEDVATVPRAALWAARLGSRALQPRRRLRDSLFPGGGTCLLHGDTPTAFLGALLAKRAGLRLAHLEAGLRSGSLVAPFPEEAIRLAVMRLSDILFAPTPEAAGELRRMGLPGEVVETGGNTGDESVRAALAQPPPPLPGAPYALMAIHRVETLHRPSRLRLAAGLAARLGREGRAVFVLHPPTQRRLARAGLLDGLRRIPGLDLRPLLPHRDFVHLLRGASFAVTDGGSVQEEAACLGVPCLLLRERTERPDGLGANVVLSRFDPGAIHCFLDRPERYRTAGRVPAEEPSLRVVRRLAAEG